MKEPGGRQFHQEVVLDTRDFGKFNFVGNYANKPRLLGDFLQKFPREGFLFCQACFFIQEPKKRAVCGRKHIKKEPADGQLSQREKYPFRRALRKFPALQLWISWFAFSEPGLVR